MKPKDVLEMSWMNLTLYSASIPSYSTDKEKKDKDFDESKDANNPNNFDAINGDDPKNKGAIKKLINEIK